MVCFFKKKISFLFYFFVTALFFSMLFFSLDCISCVNHHKIAVSKNINFIESALNKKNNLQDSQPLKIDTLIIGGGCFWCMEAIFQQTNGVLTVKSGYAGGDVSNPTYEEVCSGRTGHAEVIQIIFDESHLSMYDLLQIFFSLHDPTTLNQQGADVGDQYRSVIFYRNKQQKNLAIKVIKQLDAEHIFDAKIVTEVSAFSTFYPAEDYHQNYYNRNKYKGYCRMVILPKLEKFEKLFQKFKRN